MLSYFYTPYFYDFLYVFSPFDFPNIWINSYDTQKCYAKRNFIDAYEGVRIKTRVFWCLKVLFIQKSLRW